MRLVAPLLSFTADEVWQYLPEAGARGSSVHLELFPAPDEITPGPDPALLADWEQLLFIREEVLRSIEEKRREKQIGKALEAKVTIKLAGTSANLPILKKYHSSLKELFNVSQVTLDTMHIERISPGQVSVSEPPEKDLDFHIESADGSKCERCWNYYPSDSADRVQPFGDWPNVCGRCANALRQMGYSEQPV